MTKVDTETRVANAFPIDVHVRQHAFVSDASIAGGGEDTAPGPHDLFDAALASCKAITAMWYAKRKGYPLERVATHLESDNSKEREGIYHFHVKVELV
ncbi:MAG TPA: OsmC family protein, partial [Kofleriaceae bacterium]